LVELVRGIRDRINQTIAFNSFPGLSAGNGGDYQSKGIASLENGPGGSYKIVYRGGGGAVRNRDRGSRARDLKEAAAKAGLSRSQYDRAASPDRGWTAK
jgi:N-methylhydantoinase B/oxoprolinase/acetone carboxylase alpha subunit